MVVVQQLFSSTTSVHTPNKTNFTEWFRSWATNVCLRYMCLVIVHTELYFIQRLLYAGKLCQFIMDQTIVSSLRIFIYTQWFGALEFTFISIILWGLCD
jgi:hypothetical protein